MASQETGAATPQPSVHEVSSGEEDVLDVVDVEARAAIDYKISVFLARVRSWKIAAASMLPGLEYTESNAEFRRELADWLRDATFFETRLEYCMIHNLGTLAADDNLKVLESEIKELQDEWTDLKNHPKWSRMHESSEDEEDEPAVKRARQ